MAHRRKSGEKTGEFGLWLTEMLKDQPQFQVYYDHGNPEENDNVSVIKAFLGEKVTKENKLAEIDVMVVDQSDEILLLIEIEESPISPKTLLGDVFASALSSGFAAVRAGEQTYFRVTQQTQLWVAGYVLSENSQKTAFLAHIQRKINVLNKANVTSSVGEVRLIIENDLESCLEMLKKQTYAFCINHH